MNIFTPEPGLTVLHSKRDDIEVTVRFDFRPFRESLRKMNEAWARLEEAVEARRKP